jgi:WD40 repeat protein
VFSGSESGDLFRWKGFKAASVVEGVHDGPVNSIFVCKEGVVTGGKDGVVHVFNLSLTLLLSFNLRESLLLPEMSRIRSVCWIGRSVLVGLLSSEIVEINLDTNEAPILLSGHADGGILALATHPSERAVVTGGRDTTIRLWNLVERRQKEARRLDHPLVKFLISLTVLQRHLSCVFDRWQQCCSRS